MELNDKDRLDRWLDGALQQYGNPEPRTGLERRILANLESAADNRTIGGRGWWAFAKAALIACIAVTVWVGSGTNRAPKKLVAKMTPAANVGAITKPSRLIPALEQVAPASHHARRRVSPPGIEAATEPRLEQFPSARPLSEQEQMLARYVRESPQEAVLVAQAQAESQKELAKLVADESSKIELDLQER